MDGAAQPKGRLLHGRHFLPIVAMVLLAGGCMTGVLLNPGRQAPDPVVVRQQPITRQGVPILCVLLTAKPIESAKLGAGGGYRLELDGRVIGSSRDAFWALRGPSVGILVSNGFPQIRHCFGRFPMLLPADPVCAGLQQSVHQWSLRSIQVKLIKIGAKVVRHARQIIFQMAEVAVSKELFEQVLGRIRALAPAPG